MSVDSGLPPPARQGGPPARPASILLVEDEEGVRDFVRLVLTQAGYSVTPVADARKALELFQNDPGGYDLVLSDILMPGRSGTELATDLQKLLPTVRILFMSGFPGGNATHPVCVPDGAEVLDKPFSLDRLLRAVAQALIRD